MKPFFGGYIIISIFIAFIFSATVGVLLERLIIKRLYGNPLETLLGTWGVSLFLQQFVRSFSLAFGTSVIISIISGISIKNIIPKNIKERFNEKYVKLSNWIFAIIIGILSNNLLAKNIPRIRKPDSRLVDVTSPKWMRGQLEIFGDSLPKTRLVIIGITIIAVIADLIFLNLTEWGIRIRAVTQNRSMSECLGISTKKVDTITFAIGSGLAGVAGVAVSLLGSVGPDVGQIYIVPCFMVVVLGGVGNILGTVLASFGIGILTDIFASGRLLTIFPNAPSFVFDTISFFSTSSMAVVLIFSLIVIFLQFKPQGLFPQSRTVE